MWTYRHRPARRTLCNINHGWEQTNPAHDIHRRSTLSRRSLPLGDGLQQHIAADRMPNQDHRKSLSVPLLRDDSRRGREPLSHIPNLLCQANRRCFGGMPCGWGGVESSEAGAADVEFGVGVLGTEGGEEAVEGDVVVVDQAWVAGDEED